MFLKNIKENWIHTASFFFYIKQLEYEILKII